VESAASPGRGAAVLFEQHLQKFVPGRGDRSCKSYGLQGRGLKPGGEMGGGAPKPPEKLAPLVFMLSHACGCILVVSQRHVSPSFIADGIA
jgi:hypothetical protein